MRRSGRRLVIIGANVLMWEALCFGAFASGFLLPRPIYREAWFDCPSCSLKGYNHVLGWDSYPPDGVRPSSAATTRTQCGAVFGDSFTHADEVSDDEAWANQLSILLGCGVANMGVPGFGQDQAVLKYESRRPEGHFVMLGIYVEMLRRNFAASWRFYAEQADTVPKPYFVVRENILQLHSPPTQIDRQAIRAHHADDHYYQQFKVGFPFSLSLLRVMSFQLAVGPKFGSLAALQNRRDTLLYPGTRAWNVPASIDLSTRLVSRFVSGVAADGKTPVILMFPSVDYLGEERSTYEGYVASLRSAHPKVCVVDTFPPLKEYQRTHGAVRAPKGHLGPEGNTVIAETLSDALRSECGLLFPRSRSASVVEEQTLENVKAIGRVLQRNATRQGSSVGVGALTTDSLTALGISGAVLADLKKTMGADVSVTRSSEGFIVDLPGVSRPVCAILLTRAQEVPGAVRASVTSLAAMERAVPITAERAALDCRGQSEPVFVRIITRN